VSTAYRLSLLRQALSVLYRWPPLLWGRQDWPLEINVDSLSWHDELGNYFGLFFLVLPPALPPFRASCALHSTPRILLNVQQTGICMIINVRLRTLQRTLLTHTPYIFQHVLTILFLFTTPT